MSKDVRKALMIAKGQVSSGYLPPGDPQRTANLARHMGGNHPDVPKTVYHAATNDFGVFDPEKAGHEGMAMSRIGAGWLTDSPKQANYFGRKTP